MSLGVLDDCSPTELKILAYRIYANTVMRTYDMCVVLCMNITV